MIFLYKIVSELPKYAQYLVIFSIIAAILYLSHLMKRGNRSKARRKSDQRNPNGRDKQVLETAKNLISFGKFVSAAQLLESIGYVREAIGLLESKGYIDEAANILLKFQNPERAGAMYSQHGMWDKATRCYQLAQMPKEAANCSQEAGKVLQAAESFAEAGEYTKAANCYVDIGNVRDAARYYVKSSKPKQAIECYKNACDLVDDVKELYLSNEELTFIHSQLLQGDEKLFLADLLSAHSSLAPLLIDLLAADRVGQASQYYLRSTKDISQYLIDQVDEQYLSNLLNMFKKISSQELVAQVYEKKENYVDAAAYYERAENYVAAARCYEKSDNTEKAKEVKLREKSFQDDEDLKTVIVTPGESVQDEPGVTDSIPNSFMGSRIFDGLNSADISFFWSIGSRVIIDEHSDPLISSDRSPDEFFIVLTGEVNSGTGVYHEGDVVGVEWLLLDEAKGAELNVDRKSTLWRADKSAFLKLIESRPGVSRKVYQNLFKLEFKRDSKSAALAS